MAGRAPPPGGRSPAEPPRTTSAHKIQSSKKDEDETRKGIFRKIQPFSSKCDERGAVKEPPYGYIAIDIFRFTLRVEKTKGSTVLFSRKAKVPPQKRKKKIQAMRISDIVQIANARQLRTGRKKRKRRGIQQLVKAGEKKCRTRSYPGSLPFPPLLIPFSRYC